MISMLEKKENEEEGAVEDKEDNVKKKKGESTHSISMKKSQKISKSNSEMKDTQINTYTEEKETKKNTDKEEKMTKSKKDKKKENRNDMKKTVGTIKNSSKESLEKSEKNSYVHSKSSSSNENYNIMLGTTDRKKRTNKKENTKELLLYNKEEINKGKEEIVSVSIYDSKECKEESSICLEYPLYNKEFGKNTLLKPLPRKKFHFLRNKSSICVTDYRFVDLFEKYYADKKTSILDKSKDKGSERENKLEESSSFSSFNKLCTQLEQSSNNHFGGGMSGEDDILYNHFVEHRFSYRAKTSRLLDVVNKESSNRNSLSLNAERMENYKIMFAEEDKSDTCENYTSVNKRKSKTLDFLTSKSLMKTRKKEKIIIFLNHNYCVWENEKFNDHFYKTVYKKDLDNFEEIEIFIDDYKNSKLKKFIYRIFPQFSMSSLLLYISFIQWALYILLISVKAEFSLTPSINTLKNFGSNYPNAVFKKSEYYRVFTSLFLHSNFNHICANTYVQLSVGFLLEYLYGTFLMFLVYVFTGIYGIILSSPITYCTPTTESSTSSSGIIGMFFAEILIMTNFNVDKMNVSLNLACFYMLLFFLKFSLDTVTINLSSHVFGFIGGFLIGIIVKFKQLKYFVKHDMLLLLLCILFLIGSLSTAIVLTFFVSPCGIQA